jgi:NAD(P)-dependent dehydrogenase (short-subunit alcohol dehydrogenase family)
LAQVSSPSEFLAYCTSKLANVLFARALAQRLPGGRTANCFHPGVIPQTGIERGIPFPLSVAWNALEFIPGVTSTIADGGEALAHLAASSDVAGMTGTYFAGTTRRRPSRSACDRRTAERLWEISAALVGVAPELPVNEG